MGETAKRLKNYYNIKIFCTDPSGKDVGNYIWNDIEVNVCSAFSRSYCFSPSLYTFLKKEEFDIIHIHGFTTFCLLAGILNHKKSLIILNTYYHFHGSTLFYSLIRKFYDPIFSLLVQKKVDKIIAISQAEKELINNNLKIHDNIEIISPGVNIKQIQRSKPFNFEGKLVLYVGRLEKYKNVHLTIQAIQKLPNYFYFYIIGNGSFNSELRQIILKLKLENRVKILHNISDNEIYQWMKSCDVFITLSNLESFGITVIEALTAGKPVIVSNIPSLSEFVNEFNDSVFSINLDDQNIDDIVKCISKASKMKIKVNTQRYSWDETVEELKKIYKDLQNNMVFE